MGSLFFANCVVKMAPLVVGISLFTTGCASVLQKQAASYQSSYRFAVLAGKSEREIVAEQCDGIVEYTLPDRTRVDCLTPDTAWEYDRPRKWAEAIGQALHYAAHTNRTPGVVLICLEPCDTALSRIKAVSRRFNLGLVVYALTAKSDA